MKAQDWMDEVTASPTDSELPKTNDAPRGKPGPKKSLVKRKVVGLNFSDDQNRKLTELEMTLKLAGFDLPRGRSEAAELAIALATAMLDGRGPDGGKGWALGFLKSMEGIEDKQAEDDLN